MDSIKKNSSFEKSSPDSYNIPFLNHKCNYIGKTLISLNIIINNMSQFKFPYQPSLNEYTNDSGHELPRNLREKFRHQGYQRLIWQ